MVCKSCNNSKKSSKDFTRAVIEINNPDKLVLLRKVVIPASMGTKDNFPPTIGKYYNTLLQYEASGDLYLYSSDGIPTQLSSDVSELQHQLEQLGLKVDKEILDRIAADAALNNSINTVSGSLSDEVTARQNADNALQGNITALDNSLATVAKSGSYNDLSNKPTIGNATLTIKKNGSNVGTFTANATANKNIDISVPTKTSDLANDGSDGASQYVESDDLATVATSGSYNDLSNKPTIGNATLTIKRNDTSAGTFTANATTNKSINIAVPTKTSDLANDGADGTSTYVESDDLPTVDTTYSSSSNNAIANSTVTNSLDRNVMTNLALDSTPSTTTVNLNNTKTNLAHPSSTTTSSISLPVASSTQAGVMNSSTFDAIASNTSNINAILSGAVAITGLPASPTQAELTTAWENETGLTSLMNRAGIYDVTNSKVWTYYTNDNTWYAASNTSQVTVSTFTNSSEGLIKGSTNDGQVFAENDGTGSVNGWDTLTSAVSNNTSKLATIAQGAEVNVQANWTQTNTSADDYIKNKPANLVQDANYVHTDNNFTTTLKNKLDGIEPGAEVNVQADWSQSNTSADDYIKNKPTIPTVNNATLTIQKNGTNVQTFTANSSTNKTANITVPTAVSELTNDANYATTTQLNDGLATKQNTLTAGSNITITNDTISATDTTYTEGNAIDITNNVISADVYPADFFTAGESVSGEGADITLNNTINAPIENVELKGDTYQQTYTGKNLSPYPYSDGASKTIRGITFTAASDGSVTLNGTNDGTANSAYYIRYSDSSSLQFEAGTYYFIPPSNTNIGYVMRDETSYYDFSNANNYSQTFSSAKNIRHIYIQVRKGNTTTFNNLKIYPMLTTLPNPTEADYEPYVGGIPAPNPDYPQDVQTVTGEQTVAISDGVDTQSFTVNLGSTELCKIGEYQDYIYKSGDDWYVHKETGRRTYSGSDVYLDSHSYTNIKYAAAPKPTDSDAYGAYGQKLMYCTHASATGNSGTWDSAQNIGKILSGAVTNAYWFGFPPNTTLDTMQTALDGSVLYYVLATPTDTQITDAMLVGQLEALWNANTYLDTTHFFVTATGNNLPVILDIEAYRKSLDGVLESIPDAQVQSNWTQADSTAVDYIKNKPSLATVATTGSYNDLTNKPTIPTVNNATLTIKKNGSTVATFTANSSTNQTADISVPVITMTTTDPGEGSPLAANNFIGVYE